MLIKAGLFRDFRKLLTRHAGSPLDSVRFVDEPPTPFPFFLADMPTDEGGIRGRSGRVSAETAVALAQNLSTTPQYHALSEILPNEWLRLYFEKRVESRIFPAIRSLCTLEWLVLNGQAPDCREVVWNNHLRLGEALCEFWPSDVISLKCGTTFDYWTRIRLFIRRIRDSYRVVMAKGDLGFPRTPKAAAQNKPSTIAVHYVEGIDTQRRSDTFWFPKSDIDPGRIIIYFDGSSRVSRDARAQVSKKLDDLGMQRLQIRDPGASMPGWILSGSRNELMRRWQKSLHGKPPANDTERWVVAEATVLLDEVHYWLTFYEEFNVKIHVEMNESSHLTVAQSIAAHMHGGIHVGRERSDSWGFETLGHHPEHVYFAWNQRGALCAERNRNRIDSTVIAGFHYDNAWSSPTASVEHLKAELAAKGVKFVVAFFDTSFWWGGGYSRTMVRSFYEAFLQWVIDDPQVGTISKSKKGMILEDLPELEELMAQAVATGRWVNLTDVFGRLPSDASRAADISVGIGISSPVTEAVAAGSRGVHCDLRTIRTHPFYQWGYEKVIFDDLDRMMAAFKRYKSDPSTQPDLGDFSGHMDEIDPYADGRSGERAGTYLRWLLESTDQGNDRKSALRHAGQKFSAAWGAENIIHGSCSPTVQV